MAAKSNKDVPLFPFAVTKEETFLSGSYSQLTRAQESLKKFKEFKKVQIKELNEKKKQRIANKASLIKLGKFARKSSKENEEQREHVNKQQSGQSQNQTQNSTNQSLNASDPLNLPGNQLQDSTKQSQSTLNDQISSIYQANFGTGLPEKKIEEGPRMPDLQPPNSTKESGQPTPQNLNKSQTSETSQEGPDDPTKASSNTRKKSEEKSGQVSSTIASNNTQVLKQLIKSGKFSLSGDNSLKTLKRASSSLRRRNTSGGNRNSKNAKNMFDQSSLDFAEDSEEDYTEPTSFMIPGGEEKTYTDVPNVKIKVYLGPNYQEDDVHRVFGQFGQIKWLTMLPLNKHSKTTKSEICIICFDKIDSAINAKSELHGTMHKEFVAKISVTFVKSVKKRKSKPFTKPIFKGFERRKDLKEDPEVMGRKIVSYDDKDLFD